MQDTFARARTRPKGQARATIGYIVYKHQLRHAFMRMLHLFILNLT